MVLNMIDPKLYRRLPIAITIAGSDSGGGAGIQADLKTFAALQVHGTTAITSITAQNTYSVTGVQDISLDIIRKQIIAVHDDMGIDAGKTGMLHTSEIIDTVSNIVGKLGFPLVVDPVMIAKSGAKLLRDEAINTMVKKLFPIAKVVTPNKFEAEVLSNTKISGIEDMKKASKIIRDLGPEVVVVKGGHISIDEAIDVAYDGRGYKVFKSPRYSDKTTHGTGCSFSAAIAAYLARKYDVIEAIKEAKKFISIAIKYGILIGRGNGPVNPMANIFREASRYQVLRELKGFLKELSMLKGVEELVPEVGMNIAYSIIYPFNKMDIAAVAGRIRKVSTGGIIYSEPEFGMSDHLSRYILKAREYDERIRVAMNIRYDPKYIDILRKLGLKIGLYDRSKEPTEIKYREGSTIQWGVEYIWKKLKEIPDVIYHLGDIGKEPMIILLSDDLRKVIKWISVILRES